MKVTQEELEFDIKNTDNECKAYRLILEGLYILRKVPEADHNKIKMDIFRYESLLEGCEEFLSKLTDVYQEHFVPLEKVEIQE